MGHRQLYDGYEEDAFRQSDLAAATRIVNGADIQEIDWGSGYHLIMNGSGLTFGGVNGFQLTGGTITSMDILGAYGHEVITGIAADGAILGIAYRVGDVTLSSSTIGAGNDLIEVMDWASKSNDTTYEARGWGGDDTMLGGGSQCTLWGGDGNDSISSRAGDNDYLRGEAGDDTVTGAAGFDDINGNMGNDVLHGGDGDDWVVGGKDDDTQFGDAGGDVVWGNLGDDTLSGGDGADQVRGGQGDDFVDGGAGDDFVSGDRGSDTIVGGAGADLFHGSQDAGIDKVLDFRVSDGDRVMLDPDTHYTVSQVGADTVIDMGSGNQMILVGVQLSTLPSGWIFEG